MNRMMRANTIGLLAILLAVGYGGDDAAGFTDLPTTQSPRVAGTRFVAMLGSQTSNDSASSSQSGGSDLDLDELFPKAAKRPVPRPVGTKPKSSAYPDGKIKARWTVRQFSDDSELNHGPYEEYWPSGELFKKGKFEDGVPVGKWQILHDNGEMCREPTYNKGQLEGTFEVFRADKTKLAKRSYRRGLRDGEWQTFDKSGDQALIVTNYRNDLLHGKRSVFFPDGKQRVEEHYKDSVPNGPRIVWYANGTKTEEVTFRDGKRHGKATAWNEDGTKLFEAEYLDGQRVEETPAAAKGADSPIDVDG